MRQRGGEEGTWGDGSSAGQELRQYSLFCSVSCALLFPFFRLPSRSFSFSLEFRPRLTLPWFLPSYTTRPAQLELSKLRLLVNQSHPLSPFPSFFGFPLSPIWEARVAWPRALVLSTVRRTVGGTRTDQVTPHFARSETPFLCARHLQPRTRRRAGKARRGAGGDEGKKRQRNGANWANWANWQERPTIRRVVAAGRYRNERRNYLYGDQSALT
jgi:hypothetical protein